MNPRASRGLAALLAATLLSTAPALAQQPAVDADTAAKAPAKTVPIRPAAMAPLASKSLLLAATRAGDRLVAVGERGHILLSDDNGGTWRQVPSPANSALTGVHFPDPKNGWAVGHDAVILRTADGGETWELQNAAPELEQPLLDVLFADAQNGIAVGAYGLFMSTADGGKTWEERRIGEEEDDFHFNGIVAPTPETRLIAGEFGTVKFSADKGQTWTVLPTPYEGSYFDVLALGPQTFLVYGLQGNVFRTEDGGKTWSQVETGTTAGLMGGATLADGRVVLVGALGAVLTSTDGGKTFTLRQRPDRVALAEVIQAPDGRVILLGEQGILPAAE